MDGISPPVVATDDERIAETCKKFGADVVMTSETCANGTYPKLLSFHIFFPMPFKGQ